MALCKGFAAEIHPQFQRYKQAVSSKNKFSAEIRLHSPVGRFRGSPRKRLTPQREAPVAQLDRASDYESEGRTFESFRVRHFFQ